MSTGTPSHRLESTLRRFHTACRRLALLTGAGGCAGAGIGLLLLIGFADWQFHLDNVRLRTVLVIGAAVIGGLLLIARVILPGVRRFSAVETARQIEREQPHWRGALISSAEFLASGCRPDDGAPALQAAVIAETAARLTDDDLDPLLPRRMLRQSAAFAFLITAFAAAIAIADPASVSLALSRMITPGSAADWPRQHRLVLLDSAFHPIDPLKPVPPTPLGERLTIYIDDPIAGLPPTTTVYIATVDGERQSHPVERTTISDNAGRRREIGIATLRSELPQLKVRATGGDDQRMPWHTFEFAPRPAVKSYMLQLTPPAYTRQPPHEIVATGGDIAALVGTHVRLEAELDRPVREAAFQQSGLPATSQTLSDDRRRFTVEFPIPAAGGGTYFLDLLGSDGLRSGNTSRFRVEAIVDREPAVALAQPAGDLTVTPQAVIPVRIEARDDLGLVAVRLLSAEPPGSAGEHPHPLPLETPLAREATIETQIAPGALGLEPGRTLILRAEAADAFNLDGRHVVRSIDRKLSVVAPEEKHRELIARQAGIAELLDRSAELQTRAIQQTRALQLQWRTATQFAATDYDTLRRMAHDQSQIAASLHDSERGGRAQARSILDELDWNRIEDAPTQERLARLDSELMRLETDLSPILDRAFAGTLRRLSDAGASPPASAVDALADIERQQSDANNSLIELAAQFADWQRQHDLSRSMTEIVLEQSQVNRETRELGRRTLTVPLSDLPPADRAALAVLGQRQQGAAESLARFEQRLRHAATTPDLEAGEDTLHEPDVEAALNLLSKGDLINLMQRAAQLVASNAMSESAETQQEIALSLEKLEEAIRGLGEPTPESMIRRVERAEAEVDSLQNRQAQLQSDARDAAESSADSDRIAGVREQQQQLADETHAWAQRLRRQQLRDVSENAAEAAGNMAEAAAELIPDELAAALDHQAAAAEELRQTRQALKAARKALEFDQTMSEWARVATLIDGFAARQSQLVDESERLAAEQARKSGLSRSQLRTLLALGTTQAQLASDVQELSDADANAPVLDEALDPVIQQMQTAAAGLADKRLDDVTRDAQKSALEQLRTLFSDLQMSGQSANNQPTAADDADGEVPPAPSNWPFATQLKVLTRLQTGIATRTAAIHKAVAAGESPSDEQRQDLRQLAEQQSRLAELLEQLLSRETEPEPAL